MASASRPKFLIITTDQDDPGLRLRTLVTERCRLTAYTGQDYGKLFDLREDPDELYSRWDVPGYSGLRDEPRLAPLDEIVETDHALPRRMDIS